jgi:predicted nucleotidyltransferase
MVDVKNLEIYSSIEKYIKKLQKKFKVEKVYLFGSYAFGSAAEDSDIDIAVISSTLSGNRFKDNVELGVLTWGVDTRISPVGYTPEDFYNDDMLGEEIRKNGIELQLN